MQQENCSGIRSNAKASCSVNDVVIVKFIENINCKRRT
ncbi:hypothetical protein QSI_1404 [Clostridioides difficile P28]|nr:hypothetical protein QSI_1404 [Clostridioides difficile P28]